MMATKWRLAKSLIKLREQINAQYPNRSKKSDGSIGDTAHSSRTSDHNPNPKGVVTAIDITHDPANGVVGLALSEAIKDDARTKYVIFAGRIYKARTKRWEEYTGANRHDHHVHVSVVADAKGYDDAGAWNLGSDAAKLVNADKGVTSSDKPAEDTAGTPPPAPAAEVKASEVSLWARITSVSIPAGVITILGGIGKFVGGLPPYVWIAFSVLALAAMIIGFLIWRDKNNQAHERTKIVMGAAADKDKNNLRLV